MKALLLLLLLLAQPAFGDTREQKIRRIISFVEHNPLDMDLVTPDIRDELIVELRSQVREGAWGFWNPYCSALIKLGDEQTIEKLMEMAERDPERKGWLDGADFPVQPLLVPYLAKDFLRDDGEDVTSELYGGDVGYIAAPVSICRSFDALWIMRRFPAFSPEVKAWAAETQEKALVRKSMDERRESHNIFREDSVRQFRDMMRQWWRDNERHFTAKDYAAVQPGGTVSRPGGADSKNSRHLVPAAIGVALLSIGGGVIFILRRSAR